MVGREDTVCAVYGGGSDMGVGAFLMARWLKYVLVLFFSLGGEPCRFNTL